MINLRWEEGCEPLYATEGSSCCDLRAREEVTLVPGKSTKVPTGVYINDWEVLDSSLIPELQIRARSGLAHKHNITLTNSLGTVDADYPDEICVLMFNNGEEPFEIKKGDRIAQMALNIVNRLTQLKVGGKRYSGFGSTGRG